MEVARRLGERGQGGTPQEAEQQQKGAAPVEALHGGQYQRSNQRADAHEHHQQAQVFGAYVEGLTAPRRQKRVVGVPEERWDEGHDDETPPGRVLGHV